MKVRIHVRSPGRDEVLEFEETLAEIKIGRRRDADVYILDTMIARYHCGIRMEPGAAYLFDTASTNGTFLNGKRIEPSLDHLLEATSEVHLGQTILTIYVEEGDAERQAAEPSVRNEELEARIRLDPADPAAYRVYADWLADQGEPRAELIMLHNQLDQALREEPLDPGRVERLRTREVALLDEHDLRLLGLLAFYRSMVALKWRHGFIKMGHVRASQTPSAGRVNSAFRALLTSPASAFIEEISVGQMEWGSGLLFDALEELRPNSLRRLTIGAPADPLYFPARPERLFEFLGALQRLEFFGRRWVRSPSGAPEPEGPEGR